MSNPMPSHDDATACPSCGGRTLPPLRDYGHAVACQNPDCRRVFDRNGEIGRWTEGWEKYQKNPQP